MKPRFEGGRWLCLYLTCVLVVMSAACNATVPSASISTETHPPSATSAPSPIATSNDLSWGPLAVIVGGDGTDLVAAEGTLRITATCVLLDQGGALLLVVWPSNRVQWEPDSQTVAFMNLDGNVVRLLDGIHVTLVGGGGSVAESGVSPEVWMQSMQWVAPPEPGCLLDEYWVVGLVNL